jgi:hypothetical protein
MEHSHRESLMNFGIMGKKYIIRPRQRIRAASLFGLPVELRHEIYKNFAFHYTIWNRKPSSHGGHLTIEDYTRMSLMLTCRQFNSEIEPLIRRRLVIRNLRGIRKVVARMENGWGSNIQELILSFSDCTEAERYDVHHLLKHFSNAEKAAQCQYSMPELRKITFFPYVFDLNLVCKNRASDRLSKWTLKYQRPTPSLYLSRSPLPAQLSAFSTLEDVCFYGAEITSGLASAVLDDEKEEAARNTREAQAMRSYIGPGPIKGLAERRARHLRQYKRFEKLYGTISHSLFVVWAQAVERATSFRKDRQAFEKARDLESDAIFGWTVKRRRS